VTSSDIPTGDSTDAKTGLLDVMPDPIESIWAAAHMHLLRRAPYLATRKDLRGDWAGDPRKWRFNLGQLDKRGRWILGRFYEAAVKLYLDFDVDPLLATDDDPWDRIRRWLGLPLLGLDEILRDTSFRIMVGYRRLAIAQLIEGHWTADEGRQFLEMVDLSYREGCCTLCEFGEFVVALDQAEARAAS
jgi:hypothetical protein